MPILNRIIAKLLFGENRDVCNCAHCNLLEEALCNGYSCALTNYCCQDMDKLKGVVEADILARERVFIEEVSGDYPGNMSAFEKSVRRSAMNAIKAVIPHGGSVLELGCADGYMSAMLAEYAGRHVVVDASSRFIGESKKQVPAKVEFVESLFETYVPNEPFDLVVMSFVLEHVLDPVALMRASLGWLKPDNGRVFAVVPNMRAQSRLLGRAMGVVGELDELTPNDLAHGHRRCYDRARFDREVTSAGGRVLLRGGLMLKPFANFQMDRIIDDGIIGEEQLSGLEKLGQEFPDACAALYSVFS